MIVLIVDDDLDDFDLFASAIKIIDDTAVCISCSDGQKALNLLDNVSPDYIIMDINMPLMDGKQCLRELKKDVRMKHIPVIMWSTTTSLTERSECKTSGAMDFLVKPNEITSLCSQLSLIFTKR
jgi:DNA-binding response OmpR family regulator